MVVATQIPSRSEISIDQTWNAESVFPNLAAWEAEKEAITKEVPKYKDYEGRLSESPDVLADYWDFSSKLNRRISKLYFYGAMNSAVDSLNEDYKALVGQVMGIFAQASQLAAFENPELLAMGKDKLLDWIRKNERLAIYEKAVDDLFRQQAHVKSAEVEAVLGAMSEPFGAARQIADELTDTDLQFPDATDSNGNPYPITQSNIEMVKANPDRAIRRSGWNNYADRYLEFKNTLAAAYITSVKQSTMMYRVRGYDSVLQMQLFANNIPVSVFHTLIDTYKKNLPTWHRYWDVKRRVLGYDTIHPYDIWSPMTVNEPAVSWEQSIDWICEGMKPLGTEYVDTVRKGCLEQRWVDRAINQGKRQGAFSYGTYDTMPFIMMSYSPDLGAMSTLAHEIGHSMHSYLSNKHQQPVYADYSLFVAEVASNFNQAMTRAYLFEAKKDDRDFQLALIQEAMDNFHRYFFIMPTLARFEYEVHERVNAGKPLTADILNGIMSDLFAEGYGTTMTDDRERTGITWATFGHLYAPYYTFQYATGISAAHALADKVLSGEANAAANYVKFLSSGSSAYPLDILKIAGVDMTTPEAIERTFKVLSGLVDRLEALVG
jgi:oligoendopeptidase F